MTNRINAAFLMVAAAFLIALGTPAAATAQEEAAAAQEEPTGRAWQVGLWLKGGYQRPGGRLAKNSASDSPSRGFLETVFELNPSSQAGGGIEVRVPAHDFAVRIGWETTRDAEATGQIAVCALLEGRLCEPEVAPVTIQALTSQLRIAGGNADAALRPVIFAGLDVRRFAFEVPVCPSLADDDASLVCNAITDLFEDPGTHLFLRGGIGLQATAGRLGFEVAGSAGTGRYNGGAGRTDGIWYQDLRVEVSTSFLIL